ncbi:MAG TPA: TetR/AcrR family transcriptional regulator [Acidimicrobiales bacterium]|nr:TetR/AcrR family transcriptional regulator [Acidimicrobiales bacterium]
MTDAAEGVRIDGRIARSQRTRDAIVDACIALVEAGDYRPTAPRIAEAAGVSERSVFQHFDDLESLFTAVAERAVERVSMLLVPVDPDLELNERIGLFVRQRSQLFEAVWPIRRAAAAQEPFADTIGRWLDLAATFLRAEVVHTFGVEVSVDEFADVRLEALDSALGWSTWDGLRRRSKLDVDRAVATVCFSVVQILAPAR